MKLHLWTKKHSWRRYIQVRWEIPSLVIWFSIIQKSLCPRFIRRRFLRRQWRSKLGKCKVQRCMWTQSRAKVNLGRFHQVLIKPCLGNRVEGETRSWRCQPIWKGLCKRTWMKEMPMAHSCGFELLHARPALLLALKIKEKHWVALQLEALTTKTSPTRCWKSATWSAKRTTAPSCFRRRLASHVAQERVQARSMSLSWWPTPPREEDLLKAPLSEADSTSARAKAAPSLHPASLASQNTEKSWQTLLKWKTEPIKRWITRAYWVYMPVKTIQRLTFMLPLILEWLAWAPSTGWITRMEYPTAAPSAQSENGHLWKSISTKWNELAF